MSLFKELNALEDWNAILKESEMRDVFLFKHSTRCSISAAAYREVEKHIKQAPNENTLYCIVKVLESRPVSNEIATSLGVKHESPQGILIRKNQAIWKSSHFKLRLFNLLKWYSMIRKSILGIIST